jgi:hypothetical protein
VPSFSHDHRAPAEGREHEYWPEELLISFVVLVPALVSAKELSFGGWTAWVTVVGELPVVT